MLTDCPESFDKLFSGGKKETLLTTNQKATRACRPNIAKQMNRVGFNSPTKRHILRHVTMAPPSECAAKAHDQNDGKYVADEQARSASLPACRVGKALLH